MSRSRVGSPNYGHPKPTARCKKSENGWHCAHLTGRYVDQPMEPSNACEVECCWCGEKIEVAFRFGTRQVYGHGPKQKEQANVYDWPKGWEGKP